VTDLTISVALCTYNGAAYLREQLESILNQTVRPAQLVISDDGSTDATVSVIHDVLSSWREANPQLVLESILLQNAAPLGVTANFEQALAACTGDLVALSDQDDLWPAGRLERMRAEFAGRPGLLLLHSDARLVDAGGEPLNQSLLDTLFVSVADRAAVHEGRAVDALLRRNIVTGATMMLRRSLLQVARPFPAAWVHDEWLAMVAAITGEVDLLEEPLTDYRQHGGNQIGVASLSVTGKVARLRLPRTVRNRQLLDRATVLLERAPRFVPAPSVLTLAKIAEKASHERMRSALPAARMRRLRPVLAAWRRGHYQDYGLGLSDVLRDLVQPV
jgi:hypothetical protein